MTAARIVVLFDGVCNLCNAAVDFLIARDPRRRFVFGALQSEAARPLLRGAGLEQQQLESMLVIEGGRAYRRSTAALRIARALGGAWPLLYALVLVPPPLRDAVYDWLARRRYRWFGVRETCRIPTPEERVRFLA